MGGATRLYTAVDLAKMAGDEPWEIWDRLPDGEVPDGYIPVPPDLVVEVVSPSDEPRDIAKKQELYRRADAPLVWWV